MEPANRLQNANGPWGQRTFTYDGVGNMLTDSRLGAPDAPVGIRRRNLELYGYTYNNANRLKTVSFQGNLVGTYTCVFRGPPPAGRR